MGLMYHNLMSRDIHGLKRTLIYNYWIWLSNVVMIKKIFVATIILTSYSINLSIFFKPSEWTMVQTLSGSQKNYFAIDSGDNFTSCEKQDQTSKGAWLCVMKMKLSVTCNKSIYRRYYSIPFLTFLLRRLK